MAYRNNLWKYVHEIKEWDQIVAEFASNVQVEHLQRKVINARFVNVETVYFDILEHIPENVKEEFKPRLEACWKIAWEAMYKTAIKFATCPKLQDAKDFLNEGLKMGVLTQEELNAKIKKLNEYWEIARNNREGN